MFKCNSVILNIQFLTQNSVDSGALYVCMYIRGVTGQYVSKPKISGGGFSLLYARVPRTNAASPRAELVCVHTGLKFWGTALAKDQMG